MIEVHGQNHPSFESIAQAFVGRHHSLSAVYTTTLGFSQNTRLIIYLIVTCFQSHHASHFVCLPAFLDLVVNSPGDIGGHNAPPSSINATESLRKSS